MAEQIGCPHAETAFSDKSINIMALMGRLELYVQEAKWKRSDPHTKRALYSVTCQAERLCKTLLRTWNLKRSELRGRVQMTQIFLDTND